MPLMNIRNGYNSKKVVTFDMQDRLDDKLDKITSMMTKLTAQGSNQNRPFNSKIIKAKGEDKQEIIMIKANINIDTDQIVEIGECHLEVELSTDRIIEEGCNMSTIIEVMLGQEIVEEHKIIQVKILEVDIEVTIKMKIVEKVKVGLEKESIQIILEGVIKVVVDQDQV